MAPSLSGEVLTLYLLVGEICVVLGFATFHGPPAQTFVVRVLAHTLFEELVESAYTIQSWPAGPAGLIPIETSKRSAIELTAIVQALCTNQYASFSLFFNLDITDESAKTSLDILHGRS